MDKVLLRRRGTLCFIQEQPEESTKRRNHGVGFAVRESIVTGMDKGEVAVECISARLMKVRNQLKREI